jgi:hypothetical protein
VNTALARRFRIGLLCTVILFGSGCGGANANSGGGSSSGNVQSSTGPSNGQGPSAPSSGQGACAILTQGAAAKISGDPNIKVDPRFVITSPIPDAATLPVELSHIACGYTSAVASAVFLLIYTFTNSDAPTRLDFLTHNFGCFENGSGTGATAPIPVPGVGDSAFKIVCANGQATGLGPPAMVGFVKGQFVYLIAGGSSLKSADMVELNEESFARQAASQL